MSLSAEQIVKRVDLLHSQRANWSSYWQDLARFCLPQKAYITRSRVSGERLDFHQIFDNEAIRDLQTMAAGFSSNLTNPSSKWFSLGTRDSEFMKSKAVLEWFKRVEDEIFATLSTSNFESTMQEFYMDSGCFGTGTIITEQDFKTRVRFTEIPIEEEYIEEDDRGRVNKVYRRFEYTVQQAFERWGKNAGAAVAEQMKDDNETNRLKKLKFIHCTTPRDERDPSKKDNINMPVQSIWVEVSKKEVISEGGFQEMPYQVGRFRHLTGEAWGYSPAMNAIDDIRMLNAEKRTLIRAAMKIVDPPAILPYRGFIQPLNFNPSAVNYVKDQKPGEAYSAIQTKGNIGIGIELINEVKDGIKKAFFVPVFQAFSEITKQMTVPEVQKRIAENMTLLGPAVGRFTQEVFDPLITRVFMILFRSGVLPPPPSEIQGQELDIVYISQLAKAQRLSEINDIESLLIDVQAVAGVLPNVVDNIDGDKVIRLIHRIRRVDPDIIRSSKDVEIIRQARAQAEAVQAQLAQAEQVAGIVKTGAEAMSAEK